MDLESCSSSLCSTHYSTPKKPLWFFCDCPNYDNVREGVGWWSLVRKGLLVGAKNEFFLCVTLTDVDP